MKPMITEQKQWCWYRLCTISRFMTKRLSLYPISHHRALYHFVEYCFVCRGHYSVLTAVHYTLSLLLHWCWAMLLSPQCQWSNPEDCENHMTPLGARSLTTASEKFRGVTLNHGFSNWNSIGEIFTKTLRRKSANAYLIPKIDWQIGSVAIIKKQ